MSVVMSMLYFIEFMIIKNQVMALLQGTLLMVASIHKVESACHLDSVCGPCVVL